MTNQTSAQVTPIRESVFDLEDSIVHIEGLSNAIEQLAHGLDNPGLCAVSYSLTDEIGRLRKEWHATLNRAG